MIIRTSVVIGKLTQAGSLYEFDAVNDAILEFNGNLKLKKNFGGILNRQHIQLAGEPTHSTKRLFIDSSLLFAEIEWLNDDIANEYANKNLLARPIMVLPSQLVVKDKPLIVSMITKITRVQIEVINA